MRKGHMPLSQAPFVFTRGQWPLNCATLGYTKINFFVAASCSVGTKIEGKKNNKKQIQFGCLWPSQTRNFHVCVCLGPLTCHLTPNTQPFGGCQVAMHTMGLFFAAQMDQKWHIKSSGSNPIIRRCFD